MFASNPPPTLTQALDAYARANAMLAAVDLDAETDRSLLDAAVRVQAEKNRLDGQQLRVIEAVDRRGAFGIDGAVTTATWIRFRTRQAPGEVTQQVKAAQRLREFPKLRDALESGLVTSRHVTAVTHHAIPRRMRSLSGLDSVLREVAIDATPGEVEQVVSDIAGAVDRDGTDVAPLAEVGPDERREVTLVEGIDGLGILTGTLDPLDAEALRTALTAFERPDPVDTPPDHQRSAAQRRADAFAAMIAAALRSPDAKTIDGYPAQISIVVDLLALLGLDTLADAAQVTDAQVAAIAALADVDTPTARRIATAALARNATGNAAGIGQPVRRPSARFSGPIDRSVVRRLAAHAKVQGILTLGPYRPVAVGRLHRSLPAWLRTALTAVHRRCRGPDCDRPVAWCDAHHHDAWDDDGDTDLNQMTPECRAHHTMLTSGGWTVTLDCETGTATWTGPHGQTIRTHPPPL